MKILSYVVAATIFEAVGDAVMRVALRAPYALPGRIGLFALASFLLTMYGLLLNLAPLEFATVTGIYLASLVRGVSNREFSLLSAGSLGWRTGWRHVYRRGCSDYLLLEVSNVRDAPKRGSINS